MLKFSLSYASFHSNHSGIRSLGLAACVTIGCTAGKNYLDLPVRDVEETRTSACSLGCGLLSYRESRSSSRHMEG